MFCKCWLNKKIRVKYTEIEKRKYINCRRKIQAVFKRNDIFCSFKEPR